MRRSDRLFEIIQIVRDGRLHLARDLASALEVSTRTIYRDVESLVASGIPIEGERGVGYMLREPIFLPPMNLTSIELEALHLGMALVSKAADPELQVAAKSLSDKIEQALPSNRKAPDAGWGYLVIPTDEAQAGFRHMPALRSAIRSRRKLEISYQKPDHAPAARIIRPLELEYWGRVWTCSAWCEWRSDFRMFRVDRIRQLTPLEQEFAEEPGKTLADFWRAACRNERENAVDANPSHAPQAL